VPKADSCSAAKKRAYSITKIEPSNCSEVVPYPAATGRHASLEGSEIWYTLSKSRPDIEVIMLGSSLTSM
jgi:hypothetical protein